MSLHLERNRIVGSANSDFQACLAADLGSALGQMLGSGNVVVTGRDGKGFSRLMKRALTCGIMENGIQVLDTRLVPTPVVRYCTTDSASDFGVYLGFSSSTPGDLVVSFFDESGALASGEVVGGLLDRLGSRDRLVSAQEVGDIMFFAQAYEGYRTELLSAVDTDAIVGSSPRVLLDCSNGAVSVTVPRILRGLNCDVTSFHDNAPAYLTHSPVISDDDLMADFAGEVSDNKADLGLAFDPCGESVRVVDDSGGVLSQEDLGLILAESTDAGRIAVTKDLERGRLADRAEIRPLKREYNRIMPGDLDAALGADNEMYLAGEHRPWWDAAPFVLKLVEIVSKGQRLSELVAGL